MLKIKIEDIDFHRNECLFRPFLMNAGLFRDIGIEFVFDGNRYDMVWIGQASYMDKSKPYNQSIQNGIDYVNKFKGQDVILFDGQDSASLKGSWDVFKETDAKLLLKNTLYKDLCNYSSYNLPTNRLYWRDDTKDHWKDTYHISTSDRLSSKFQNIKLSGTNWLSLNPTFTEYSSLEKDIDVFAMFQYPAKQSFEWGIEVSKYYTEHRKKCINQLKLLLKHIKVVTAEDGKVPLNEYYNLMSRAKIVVAPFGYGEIAPRDLESAMLGCILIKPDMEHIDTIPNTYSNPNTFINCEWDYSDLNDLVVSALTNFQYNQEYYVENMRRSYRIEYNPENLINYTHSWISGSDGYETEKI